MKQHSKKEREGKENGLAMRAKQDGAGAGKKAAEIAAHLEKFTRRAPTSTLTILEKTEGGSWAMGVLNSWYDHRQHGGSGSRGRDYSKHGR